MMTFRKLSADSDGRLIRAYFTEGRPDTAPIPDPLEAPTLDPGGRMTSYYMGKDRRASWRPDMPKSVAAALGIDATQSPSDAVLDHLFEAKRGDNGEAWSVHKRKISAYDLTLAPHKSVSLAVEFARSPAEAAMIRHALDRAGDATMRYVARELGWARLGDGGKDGAEPGAVAWAAFRHHNARPTQHIQDGKTGVTYLADVPVPGDPHEHTHYALFNAVVTDSGRVGSLDTKRLHSRVHEFGAYFQALLAEELRSLGINTHYDKQEQAVVLSAIPEKAVDQFSKSRRQVLGFAKRFAADQGLDWDTMSMDRKFGILAFSGLAAQVAKSEATNEHELWRAEARALGWDHTTVLENVKAPVLTDEQRFDNAYRYAARHLEKAFKTAAVIDHDLLRTFAVRGLIGVGIEGGYQDIDRVVELIESRGIKIEGEHAALLTGVVDERVRVTNTAQVRIERSLAQKAARAAVDHSGALSEATITGHITQSGLDFERENEHGKAQKAAIYALGMGGNLTVLTGVAGSGKTTLLTPLVAAYKADQTYSEGGRDIIGISSAWKQADALKKAGIEQTVAVEPFFHRVASGKIKLSANTVVVIDEVSQVAPRSFLKLLELQAEHGFTVKALGDREQCQAIEAGDTIEILRRVLPKVAMPELLTTVRQETARAREIAGMFRDGRTKEAFAMKREDGTAWLVGGDQDQVIDRIADLYMQRRDVLAASGSPGGITVSALTNEDAADISRVIRARLKARGEIGNDERTVKAISQNRQTADLLLATGDKVRLFAKTYATINGAAGYIGSNGHIVEVAGWLPNGILLRDSEGRVGAVDWSKLRDQETGRALLSYGHASTIDSSQGNTTDEHINAMPRGSAGATGFKMYTAESRHMKQVFTVISEAAMFEAVKHGRALGDRKEITTKDLWDQVAEDTARKEYKPLGIDLLSRAEKDREQSIQSFLRLEQHVTTMADQGRHPGVETRVRMKERAIGKTLQTQIVALDEALRRNGAGTTALAAEVEGFLREMKNRTTEMAEQGVAMARSRRVPEIKPHFSPSPF